MDQVVTIILGMIGLFFVLGFGGFALISMVEGEHRAMKLSSGLMLLSGAVFMLAVFLPPLAKLVLLGLLFFGGSVLVVMFVLPVGVIVVGTNPLMTAFAQNRDCSLLRRASPTPSNSQPPKVVSG
jgi:ABC-type transport system involved in multi-copper enzyme maturation permease subunit